MPALSFGYSNLAGHIYAYPDDTVALQSRNGNIVRRLQLHANEDTVKYYKSTDGGATWPVVEQLITSRTLVLMSLIAVDLFYDAASDTCVLKWRISDNNQYQLCAKRTGLVFDHWDGTQWTNIWIK